MILPEKGDPIIVQGITGKYGSLHASLMLRYGTNIAAGVTPGKAGETVSGVKVYDRVADAVQATGAASSVIFVPAPRFYDAAEEALTAGIKLVVAITEHVPIRDELKLVDLAMARGATVIGPNTPGLIIPSRVLKLGIMPVTSFRPGTVALFSRSGTLMYEIANQLSLGGFGQSVAIGIGGDPVTGLSPTDAFDFVNGLKETKAIVAVGEIGGDAEERLARHIARAASRKPVVAYVAGRHAPKEKKMGHAGAIIYGNVGTADSKIAALREAGVKVAMTPLEVPALLKQAIS